MGRPDDARPDPRIIDFGTGPIRVLERFARIDEWRRLAKANPSLFDGAVKREIIARMQRNGIIDPLSGQRIRGAEIIVVGEAYHNTITAGDLIARNRATLLLLDRLCPGSKARGNFRLYAAEGITGFARRLRESFPLFIGSEYASTEEKRKAIYPVPHQDLCALTFGDAVFDAVVTQDVLEHVPTIETALREIARVLVPGGWSINAHPFLCMNETSLRQAKLVEGEIVHLSEPVYHGDPMSPDGVLVFELPAWDILERARSAGFSRAEMWFILDERRGVLADTGGLFLSALHR